MEHLENQNLPLTFCIKTWMGQREGYYLLRWSHGGLDPNNKIIHILKPANHMNREYTIRNSNRTVSWSNEIISRKNNGNVTRSIRWTYTDKKLTDDDGLRIPVIQISPSSTSLPNIKPSSFIPIIIQPIVQNTTVLIEEKNYPITTIPQHVIMALLRDAAMQEETCPITTFDLDIENGAITSCFHLFEKNAIRHWLSMPSSNNKCPICNTPCNVFTIDTKPPLVEIQTSG